MGYMNPSDTVGAGRTPVKHLERSPVKKAKKNKTKYKKAPQAPRRFKSAYMFFSTCKHKEIREELGLRGIVEKTTNIAKLVSVAWKELSLAERERWEELARQDKARFEVEKSLYTGPWKVPAKKKSEKDPNAPKRPMSAFLAYSHARRAEVKKNNASMSNAEISRALASMWKGAPEKEKKEHIDKEYKLRQKYLTEIAIWRENTEKELSEQRRHREEIAMKTVRARGGPAAIQEEMAQKYNQAYEKEGGAQSPQGAYPGYYPPPHHYYGHHYYGGPAQDYRGSQYPPTPYSYQSTSKQPLPYDRQNRPSESQQQEGYQNGEYYSPNYGYYPPPTGTSGYPSSGHEHYSTNGYGGNDGEYLPSSQPGQNAFAAYYDQQAPYPPPTAAQSAASESHDRGGQYVHQLGYSYGDNNTRDSKPAAASVDYHRSESARGGREEEGGGQPLVNNGNKRI